MPVVFDEHHLSEVQNMASEEKLDQVVDSMKESKVALIGKDLQQWSVQHRGGLCSACRKCCLISNAFRCFQRAGIFALRSWRKYLLSLPKGRLYLASAFETRSPSMAQRSKEPCQGPI